MKRNSTRVLLLLAAMFSGLFAVAQPDLVFKNPTRLWGSEGAEGSLYYFKNVRSGTDAFVTITDVHRVTCTQVDYAGGFGDAFQPYIYCPPRTKGHVEFRIDFVYSNSIFGRTIGHVPITALNIDGATLGSNKVYEFDEFNLSTGYYLRYDLVNSSLDVQVQSNRVVVTNATGQPYANIDTTHRDVMFTIVHSNVSSITFRVGIENLSNNAVQRVRSNYFGLFTYPESALAGRSLKSFKGVEKNRQVDLQWELNSDHSLSQVVIEKAFQPDQFQSIGEVWVDGSRTKFHFTDHAGIQHGAYYRLKMVPLTGDVQYSSILSFRASSHATGGLQVFPSVVRESLTVSVHAQKAGPAVLQVVDYAGRIVKEQRVVLSAGSQNMVLHDLSGLHAGNYVVVLRTAGNEAWSKKIYKQ